MQMLFTLLDHTALIFQAMDRYIFDQSEADTIIFSFYAVLRGQGMLAQLSLVPLIQMFTLQQHTYLINFLVCCALRGSRKLSCIIV